MKGKTLAIAFWILVGVAVIVWAGPKFVSYVGDFVDDATTPITLPAPPGS